MLAYKVTNLNNPDQTDTATSVHQVIVFARFYGNIKYPELLGLKNIVQKLRPGEYAQYASLRVEAIDICEDN